MSDQTGPPRILGAELVAAAEQNEWHMEMVRHNRVHITEMAFQLRGETQFIANCDADGVAQAAWVWDKATGMRGEIVDVRRLFELLGVRHTASDGVILRCGRQQPTEYEKAYPEYHGPYTGTCGHPLPCPKHTNTLSIDRRGMIPTFDPVGDKVLHIDIDELERQRQQAASFAGHTATLGEELAALRRAIIVAIVDGLRWLADVFDPAGARTPGQLGGASAEPSVGPCIRDHRCAEPGQGPCNGYPRTGPNAATITEHTESKARVERWRNDERHAWTLKHGPGSTTHRGMNEMIPPGGEFDITYESRLSIQAHPECWLPYTTDPFTDGRLSPVDLRVADDETFENGAV